MMDYVIDGLFTLSPFLLQCVMQTKKTSGMEGGVLDNDPQVSYQWYGLAKIYTVPFW